MPPKAASGSGSGRGNKNNSGNGPGRGNKNNSGNGSGRGNKNNNGTSGRGDSGGSGKPTGSGGGKQDPANKVMKKSSPKGPKGRKEVTEEATQGSSGDKETEMAPEDERVLIKGEVKRAQSSYSPGDIIYSFTVEQDFSSKIIRDKQESRRQFEYKYKTRGIYMKHRFLVVIAKFYNHLLFLPIYSYDGKGLQGRRAHAINEHIAIKFTKNRREHAYIPHPSELSAEARAAAPDSNPGEAVPQADWYRTLYGTLSGLIYPDQPESAFRQHSLVDVSRPGFLRYDFQTSKMATLDGTSLLKLRELFVHAMTVKTGVMPDVQNATDNEGYTRSGWKEGEVRVLGPYRGSAGL
ncbi:hypothetical protein PVAG01_09409 [Phlyctema vagabunda]|uniref:DUF6590 domain-containing protein n=1 Tax=Phlyctema vagabunda TaxID=108571 RepID=A0ABR4P7F2_9HELO